MSKTGDFGANLETTSNASIRTHQQLMDSRERFEAKHVDERQYSTSPLRQRDTIQNKNDGLASYNTQQKKGLIEPSKHSDYYGVDDPATIANQHPPSELPQNSSTLRQFEFCKISLLSEEPYFLPGVEFMMTTSGIDSINTTVLESQKIPAEKLTLKVQAQISNALWLLHKLLIQDDLPYSVVTQSTENYSGRLLARLSQLIG